MKKINLLTCISITMTFLLSGSIKGQTFTEQAVLSPVVQSSSAWGDYDHDGDLDILLTGSGLSKIYRNDSGTFTDIAAALAGVMNSSAEWGDYDNDGDLDILITGSITSVVYRNDNGIFTNISAGLVGIDQGSGSWGDYDNDGDLDILISGMDGSAMGITEVYRNDNGTFTIMDTGLIGVIYGSSGWCDFDNDGDLDISLTGYTNNYERISRIYRNDKGSFTDIEAGLPGVIYSSMSWGDYDSDGYQDLFLCGNAGSRTISYIFRNNNGVFANINADLLAVQYGSGTWGDCDNDGDLDLIIEGTSVSGYITKIYKNDSGAFTELIATLPGIYRGSVAWGDYDGDSDLDILLTGNNISKVFRNESGNINTVPVKPSGLVATAQGSDVILSWNKSTDAQTPSDGLTYNVYIGSTSGGVNKRSPMAILPGGYREITRRGYIHENSWRISKLPAGTTYYWSVQAVDNSFAGSAFATQGTFSVAFSNSVSPSADQLNSINKDGTELTVTESGVPASRQWKYSTTDGGPYSNIINGETGTKYKPRFGTKGIYYVVCESVKSGIAYTSNQVKVTIGDFSEKEGTSFANLDYSFVAWGDYDNDRDLDLYLSGSQGGITEVTKIYRNDSGVFNDISAVLANSGPGYWSDFDNDGDLDLLMLTALACSIYQNTGGTFSEIAKFPGIITGSAALADYDNDGDQDILVTGQSENGNVTTLIRNERGGFKMLDTEFSPVYLGSAAWGDYDNDGDQDLLLTGNNVISGDIAKIYNNDKGIFTDISADLYGASSSAASWGDYDNDGDLDILISGSFYTNIYKNNNGTFTQSAAILEGLNSSSVAWGDYDNDGDLDILLSGKNLNQLTTRIYRNDNGNFTNIVTGLPGINNGSVAWGDYDNDGDLDIALTGSSIAGAITKIYVNNIAVANTTPSVPTGLTASYGQGKVRFSWNKSTDSSTPQEGLSYNLYVGSSPGGIDQDSPMSEVSGGYRRIVMRGNQSNSWFIDNLLNGTYYWSVQAIDNSFAGSAFAAEQSFSVPFVNYIEPDTNLFLVINQAAGPFNVLESSTADSRQWKYSTMPGGPYSNNFPGATGTSYSPVFSEWGTYYVVCESVKDGTGYTSNEVKISVSLFTLTKTSQVLGVTRGGAKFGDYDNDGDLDLLINGTSNNGTITRIYKNDAGVYSDIGVFMSGTTGSVNWGDYDNDGDLDVLSNAYIFNNNAGTFNSVSTGIISLSFGSSSWGDYDNDGDLDIVITGSNAARIYRNDGATWVNINAPLTGVLYSSSAWGDYDNDGDLDLLITGSMYTGLTTRIYRNDSGAFTPVTNTLPGISYGTGVWGDYDNDGDLDILLSGNSASGLITKIFRNDNGVFPDINAGLPGLRYSNASWGDFDNDGDLDFVISGLNSSSLAETHVYRNDNGTFTDIGAMLTGKYYGTDCWGDYDNDGDLDLVITGQGNNGFFLGLYKNNIQTTNAAPGVPSSLSSVIGSNTVTLSWSKPTDDKTSQNGLSYNIYIGSAAGTWNKKSPMANISGGFRKIAQKELQTNSWTVKNLPAGTYYWSVQAIDNTFKGSAFAAEKSFTLNYSASVTPVSPQSLAINQVGTSLTVNESAVATSRQWKYSKTSGGPYDQIIAGATGTSYLPAFAQPGTYYVVCESTWSSSKYYSNEVKVRASLFTNSNLALPGTYNGKVVWGDFDGDNDLDLFSSGTNTTRIFANSGSFNDIVAGLPVVTNSSAAWCDYDNDNDLDLLIGGTTTNGAITKIYNNNLGVFTDIKANLSGIRDGSVSWGDYDNDGDQDILICGNSIAKIYTNHEGIFSELTAGMPGVTYGNSAWGDYDNDGDLDVLLAGAVGSDNIARVYNNDNGLFTDINAGLTGVSKASLDWGDYDGDGDLDILLSGTTAVEPLTIIYQNNNGVFTDIGAGLPGIIQGSVTWGDYDNDGDLDVLISGSTNSSEITRIYRNDANVFTDIDDGLPGIQGSSVAFGDYDNDGDLDIAMSGTGSQMIAYIYRNNGTAVNTIPAAPTGLSAVSNPNKITFSWNKATDNNTPQNSITYDIYIGTAPGSYDKKTPAASVPAGKRKTVQKGIQSDTWYIKNLHAGTYYWSVQAIDNAMSGSAFSAENSFTVGYSNSIIPAISQTLGLNSAGTLLSVVESAPADSRQWKYSLVPGGPYNNIIPGASGTSYTPVFPSWGKYYVVCQSVKSSVVYTSNEVIIDVPVFIEQKNLNLEGIRMGSAAWGDFDNDGDLDIIEAGVSLPGSVPVDNKTKIYSNQDGAFTEISARLKPVFGSSVVWSDYDNDNDLDITLTGMMTSSDLCTKIYQNDSGVFTEINPSLPGVYQGSVAWGDIDHDGDQDLLITGMNNIGVPYAGLFRNDKNGMFTDMNINLEGVTSASASLVDYDNDGDLDIFLAGTNPASNYISKLYRNDNGTFTDIAAALQGVSAASSSWGDYDNDGDNDLLLTGNTGAGYMSEIYRNDAGTFTAINAGLPGVTYGSCAWGDYDNDGDLDLVISGQAASGYIASVYNNQGGVFSEINSGLIKLYQGVVTWGDYDKDGDLDILSTGWNLSEFFTRIYKNSSPVLNTVPSAPAGLNVSHATPLQTLLSWNPSTDTETPQNTLTYNMRLGSGAGMNDIISPMASLQTGFRKKPTAGNAGMSTSHTIYGLPYGRYWWSVQAIDQTYSGGNWSAEQSFTILIAPQAMAATAVNNTSFTANWLSSAGAAGYRIDVSTDPSFSTFVTGYDNKDAGSGTSATVSGLAQNTTYYYRVRAYCSDGTSLNSGVINLTTLLTPPPAPTGLAAFSCNDSIHLSWTPINASNFMWYKIYGGTSPNPTAFLAETNEGLISQSSYSIPDLVDGQTYYLRMKAVTAGPVESSYSEEISVKVKKGAVPRIKAKWNDVLICYNTSDSLTSYQWYKDNAAITDAVGQYYVSNKSPGSYSVLATDINGCRNMSAAIDLTGIGSLEVYPNPVSTAFRLKLNSEAKGKAVITMYSSSGARICEYKTEKTDQVLTYDISAGNIQKGIYTLEVKIDEDEVSYIPVIIIK